MFTSNPTLVKATITTNHRFYNLTDGTVQDEISLKPESSAESINAFCGKIHNFITSKLFALIGIEGSLDLHVTVRLFDYAQDFGGDIKVEPGEITTKIDIEHFAAEISTDVRDYLSWRILETYHYNGIFLKRAHTEKKSCVPPQE